MERITKPGRLSVVVGAQYGSEAKGAVAALLASPDHPLGSGSRPVTAVRVAGPNAGHTVVGTGPDGQTGHPWRLRTVPVAAVSNPKARLVIAAGSEVEIEVLQAEVDALDAAGYGVSSRLYIDAQATVLTDTHKQAESDASLVGRIGSTGKGIGAARAARLMRQAEVYGSHGVGFDTAAILRTDLLSGAHVVIEGTQGYGLGLHAGHYPQCTSSDCTATDFLAMAGISPWLPSVGQFGVWAVARTYPIRVAGNSGPLKDETSWEALGRQPELTTVTQKVRRVGGWDSDLAWRAVQANGGAPTVRMALSMVDYIEPSLYRVKGVISLDELPYAVREFVHKVERECMVRVDLLGTGPDTTLVVTR